MIPKTKMVRKKVCHLLFLFLGEASPVLICVHILHFLLFCRQHCIIDWFLDWLLDWPLNGSWTFSWADSWLVGSCAGSWAGSWAAAGSCLFSDLFCLGCNMVKFRDKKRECLGLGWRFIPGEIIRCYCNSFTQCCKNLIRALHDVMRASCGIILCSLKLYKKSHSDEWQLYMLEYSDNINTHHSTAIQMYTVILYSSIRKGNSHNTDAMTI